MRKRGLTVVHVDAAAEAPWRKTAEAAYPRVRDVFVPAAAFDAAMALRDEYRQVQAAAGERSPELGASRRARRGRPGRGVALSACSCR